ncbi:MAG: hypothetical protein OXK19_01520 [Candidatus Dadabacteria bacterium]|nr:hypothetical protein [Candidatus Dadabacteria bacterium]
MQVTRCQYPIGQGCFSSGRIQCSQGESGSSIDFRYIYDCGTTNQGVLRDAVDSYRKRTTYVDALFISHLHVDHVNGIDRLLGAVKVGTVYIPYVNPVMPIIELIEAEAEGALSASLIESTIDPESWFGRRGVSRVVRVLASSDEGPPATEPEDGGDNELDGSPPSTGRSPLNRNPRTSRRAGGRAERSTVASGTPLRIATLFQGHHWILVPHVDPAPASHKKAFIRDIRIALNLRPRERITSTRLADALRSPTEIRNLRNCYERIVAGGSRGYHNRVSMSLYSGPAGGENGPSWSYGITARSSTWPPWWFESLGSRSLPEVGKAVGWIGTGDAALGVESVRKAWLKAYRPLSQYLSTLLLPHHGSRHNFHSELLDFPNLRICLASAAARSRYGHPDRSVVGEILNRGKFFLHVSERIHTGIREEIRSG